MPSMSRAQHKMMTAVANNPKFAKKTGIPQSVGEEFMKADKKMKKYQEGGMASEQSPITQEDIDRMMKEGEAEYKSTLPSKERTEKIKEMEEARKARIRNTVPPRKKSEGEPKMMMGGGMAKGYKAGGKVRGAGCAKKGVRPCKMM